MPREVYWPALGYWTNEDDQNSGSIKLIAGGKTSTWVIWNWLHPGLNVLARAVWNACVLMKSSSRGWSHLPLLVIDLELGTFLKPDGPPQTSLKVPASSSLSVPVLILGGLLSSKSYLDNGCRFPQTLPCSYTCRSLECWCSWRWGDKASSSCIHRYLKEHMQSHYDHESSWNVSPST